MPFTKTGYEAYVKANGGKDPFDEMFSHVKELWSDKADVIFAAQDQEARERAFCEFYPVDKTAKMLVNSADSAFDYESPDAVEDIRKKINDFRKWYLGELLYSDFVSSTSISSAISEDDELSVEYSLSLGDLKMSEILCNIDEIDYDYDDEAEVIGTTVEETPNSWTGSVLTFDEAFAIVDEQYQKLDFIDRDLSSLETICYELDVASSEEKDRRTSILSALAGYPGRENRPDSDFDF